MADFIRSVAEVLVGMLHALLWAIVVILSMAVIIGIPTLVAAAIGFVVLLLLHETFTWGLAILIGAFTELFLMCVVIDGEGL